MTETSKATAALGPLSYRSLLPLSSEDHGSWRLRAGDYSYASDAPFVPLLMSEFAKAGRSYPIVFSTTDSSPLALMGLDGANLFVRDGAWEDEHQAYEQQVFARRHSFSAPPASGGTYIPAYVRRYPFGFLRTQDDKFVLAIDTDCERLSQEGGEGDSLFVEGKPSETTQTALAFCEAFQSEAGGTLEFVRALVAKDLLIEREARLTFDDGRSLGLKGFSIIDRSRFERLDGPTVVEWQGKGWLEAVPFHLRSLDRLDALARRQVRRNAAAETAEGASTAH